MHHGGTGRRCLVILIPFFLLSIAAPDALAVDLDRMRESYDTKLRAHQKRITEIEARGRGASADPGKRADGITRDRLAEIRASLKGDGGAAKRLTELAEKASRDAHRRHGTCDSAVVQLIGGPRDHACRLGVV